LESYEFDFLLFDFFDDFCNVFFPNRIFEVLQFNLLPDLACRYVLRFTVSSIIPFYLIFLSNQLS